MVRLKHRYLLVNILYPDIKDVSNATSVKGADDIPFTVQFHQPSSDRMDARLLLQMIRSGVSELFGDCGSGMIAGSLQVKYFSPATSTAIIRVSRDHYRLVWAALTFATRLPKPVDQACVIQVVRVSGTIRKAEEEAIRRARLSIKRAQAGSKSTATSTVATTVAGVGAREDFLGFANGIEDPDELGDMDDESD